MPRLPRVHLNGILYYITQQGIQDRPLFRDQDDCQTYLDLLCQYKTKHEFKLFAYTFQPDKIHLIVEPYGATTISEIMRDLTSRYSKYCNGRYGGVGPLFKGRFHAHLAEKQTLLLQLIHFVNSLSSGAAAMAGAGNSRELFSAGHAGAAAHLKDAVKTELIEVAERIQQMGFLGGMEALASPMAGEKMDVVLKMLKDPVIGSPEFVQKVRAELAEAAARSQKEFVETAPTMAATVIRGRIQVPKWALAGMASVLCVAIALPTTLWMMNHNKPVAAVAVTPAKPAAVSAIPADVSAMLKKEMLKLDGTEWDVKLTPMAKGEQAAVEFDRISFSHDQITSKKMSEKGFSPTLYTITGTEDGGIVWETMQTGPSGETVFWRGEWNQGEMRGVLSRQAVGGETHSFQFVGSR